MSAQGKERKKLFIILSMHKALVHYFSLLLIKRDK